MINFTHKTIKGNCTIHEGFKPFMDYFCECLEDYDCQALITSSLRKKGVKVQGAIVKPAKMSNHFVGHAIDVNFIDSHENLWTSSEIWSDEIDALVSEIEKMLRWGGRFRTKDVVHFDYPLNLKDPNRYMEIYNTL